MGLLERSASLAATPDTASSDSSSPGASSLRPSGLMARAKQLRAHGISEPASNVIASQIPAAAIAGSGAGLLARSLAHRKINDESRDGVPAVSGSGPGSGSGSGSGLRQRAEMFRARESDASEFVPPPVSMEDKASLEKSTGLLARAASLSEADPAGADESSMDDSLLDESELADMLAMDGSELAEDANERERPAEDIPLDDSDPFAGGLAIEQLGLNEEDEGQEDEIDALDSEAEDVVLGIPGEDEVPTDIDAPDASDSDAMIGSEDVFADWEREAEEEAQRSIDDQETVLEKDFADSDYLFEGEDYSTRPVETHIASQKRIDNYLSLFDISRELLGAEDTESLWESVLYAAMGQMGAETVCIFSAEKPQGAALLYPVKYAGFEPGEEWALKPGEELYERIVKEKGVASLGNAVRENGMSFSDLERNILKISKTELAVPIFHKGEMLGIILIGPQLDQTPYNIDDMDFLMRLGETAGAGLEKTFTQKEYERETKELQQENQLHGKIFSLARELSLVKNLDELYDALAAHLQEDFSVESFSLVLLNPKTQEYRIFGGNELTPDSIERFRLPVSSEIIGMISNLIRVYEVADFKENAEIGNNYINDDLALMDCYWIVPLISMNWLVGFIAVHRVSSPWSRYHRELIVSTAEITAPVFANAVVVGERETIFRDPFSPLESRLQLELQKAREFQVAVSLVEIRVKNLKRLIALNVPEKMADYLAELGRTVSGILFESDFQARIGHGRFAALLPGRNRKEAEIFVKKMRGEIRRKRLLPASPTEAQYIFQIISFPEDAEDAGRMLSMMD